jgi:hypothetical protein
MSARLANWPTEAGIILFLGIAAAGCIAGCAVGGGYGYNSVDEFGADYYEPYGDYGGWGRGYEIGPRSGDHGFRSGGFHGGGGHSGGAHIGGGGHR